MYTTTGSRIIRASRVGGRFVLLFVVRHLPVDCGRSEAIRRWKKLTGMHVHQESPPCWNPFA
jgi:hypothetical protein